MPLKSPSRIFETASNENEQRSEYRLTAEGMSDAQEKGGTPLRTRELQSTML